mgnify:CR=1 FL=1
MTILVPCSCAHRVSPHPCRRGLARIVCIAVALLAFAAPLHPQASARAGIVSVVADSMPMPQLGRVRRIRVYLPPDYATTTRRFPVLYMHDGQQLFDSATNRAGKWGVDEALDSLHRAGHGGVIVVAVDNDGAHRLNEYAPWHRATPRITAEGDAYLAFLAHTLKPMIDARYRTRPEPASTAIMGSSMGALISLAAVLRHPAVFGRAGVFSCACWLVRDSIVALARRAGALTPRPRLWFVVGGNETPDDEPVHDHRLVVTALREAGYRPERDFVAHERADGTHEEWFWRREFPAAVVWLLGLRR